MQYLLDTNAVISIMNDPRSALAMHVRRRQTEQIATSSVVLAELYFGAYKSARIETNIARIASLQFEVLSFDAEDARHAGEIRSALRRSGTPIGPHDLLIAAQARSRGRILVTHNTREFSRVSGLRIEDWEM